MPERFCSCGTRLSSMSSATVCRSCRDAVAKKNQEERRRQKQQLTIDTAKAAGLVLLHSCIGPCDPEKICLCRKLVPNEEAMRLVHEEGALNFKMRRPYFLRGEAILEIGRRKQAPRASTIERSHIERGAERTSKGNKNKTPDELKVEFDLLQQRIREDLAAKDEEERVRWEVWADLQRDFYRSFTVFVPEAEWLSAERENFGRPGTSVGQAADQRTPGGIGNDVEPSQDGEVEAFEDNEQEAEDEEIEEAA
jgi:hypothetical protein